MDRKKEGWAMFPGMDHVFQAVQLGGFSGGQLAHQTAREYCFETAV